MKKKLITVTFALMLSFMVACGTQDTVEGADGAQVTESDTEESNIEEGTGVEASSDNKETPEEIATSETTSEAGSETTTEEKSETAAEDDNTAGSTKPESNATSEPAKPDTSEPESTKPETTTSEPTTEAKQPEKVWVVDKEAWTESVWVVDKPASTTEVWVVDQAAWTEVEEIWLAKCGCCGELLDYFDPNWDDIWWRHTSRNQYDDPSDPCYLAGWCEVTIPGETIYHEEVGHYETQTVPEQGHWETIEHPEEGHWETR